jgi:hypothetical protein
MEPYISNAAGDQTCETCPKIWSASEVRTGSSVPPTITVIMDWISSYIIKSHPQLGRPGIVCPYVPSALQMDTLWLALGPTDLLSKAELCDVVRLYMRRYISLCAQTEHHAQFKTLLLILPNINGNDRPSLLEDVHKTMKPFFVDAGLMLGEFFASNESPGANNPDFRPLRSPFPLFVYRRLVPDDLIFLTKRSDSPDLRTQFIQAYLRLLQSELSTAQTRAAEAELAIAQLELGADGERLLRSSNSSTGAGSALGRG